MMTDMQNQLFNPSVHWSIPTPVLYVALAVIAASLLIHAIILLARYLDELEWRESRYERLARRLGLTRAEVTCLGHCSADLGIKDKARMLTEPSEFQRVLKWAEKDRHRRNLVCKIERKLEEHGQTQRTIRIPAPTPAKAMARKGSLRPASTRPVGSAAHHRFRTSAPRAGLETNSASSVGTLSTKSGLFTAR